MDAGCFWVGGAALGAPQARFAWQVQHSEHLHKAPQKSATSEYYGRRTLLRGRCSTWSTFLKLCGSNRTLAAFAWQVQHLEHLRLVLRGRCSTRSTFIELRGSLATSEYYGLMDAGCFCLAGAALGAPQARFAWQVQHLEQLGLVLRGRRSIWSTFIELRGSPATSEYYGRRLLLLGRCSTWSTSVRLVLRGRCSTWSSSGSFCVAGLEHLRLVLCARCSTGSISVAYCEAFL